MSPSILGWSGCHRDAWLSLFMAAVVVPDTNLLPLLYRDVTRTSAGG
jgi:hypothetical protein